MVFTKFSHFREIWLCFKSLRNANKHFQIFSHFFMKYLKNVIVIKSFFLENHLIEDHRFFLKAYDTKSRKNVMLLKNHFFLKIIHPFAFKIASSFHPIFYIINVYHVNHVLILHPLTVVLLRPLKNLVVLWFQTYII